MHLEKDGFLVSDDPAKLDIDVIERLLRSSYWAPDRSRRDIEESVKNSVCFGLYDLGENRQIGLMRVVTDYCTFAWLCDVIFEEAYRSKGLGRWMLQAVLDAPNLRGMRRWILATLDAHGLYADYGFTLMAHPERWMERIAD
jgi:GNAT superfamily N-acetyltransferase